MFYCLIFFFLVLRFIVPLSMVWDCFKIFFPFYICYLRTRAICAMRRTSYLKQLWRLHAWLGAAKWEFHFHCHIFLSNIWKKFSYIQIKGSDHFLKRNAIQQNYWFCVFSYTFHGGEGNLGGTTCLLSWVRQPLTMYPAKCSNRYSCGYWTPCKGTNGRAIPALGVAGASYILPMSQPETDDCTI